MPLGRGAEAGRGAALRGQGRGLAAPLPEDGAGGPSRELRGCPLRAAAGRGAGRGAAAAGLPDRPLQRQSRPGLVTRQKPLLFGEGGDLQLAGALVVKLSSCTLQWVGVSLMLIRFLNEALIVR